MLNLTCKDISDKLRTLEKETPMTDEFDRQYGQKKTRWWDKLDKKEKTSTQQYHIVLHFICKYYNGAKFRCSDCSKKCEECYVNNSYINQTPKNDITPESVYNQMKRPEMYLWIIEALELSNENLDKCINEVEEIWDSSKHNSTKMKETRNALKKYNFTWINVENKLKEI